MPVSSICWNSNHISIFLNYSILNLIVNLILVQLKIMVSTFDFLNCFWRISKEYNALVEHAGLLILSLTFTNTLIIYDDIITAEFFRMSGKYSFSCEITLDINDEFVMVIILTVIFGKQTVFILRIHLSYLQFFSVKNIPVRKTCI